MPLYVARSSQHVPRHTPYLEHLNENVEMTSMAQAMARNDVHHLLNYHRLAIGKDIMSFVDIV